MCADRNGRGMEHLAVALGRQNEKEAQIFMDSRSSTKPCFSNTASRNTK